MAKILYTLCGVGLGHATRSKEIIKDLVKDNEIFIASYGDAYGFLTKNLKSAGNSEKLSWFELVFKDDKYKKARTLVYNLPMLPLVVAKNFVKLLKLTYKFKPDIIISDFDINGVYIAQFFGLPVITISNMHLMNFVDIDLKTKEKIEYYLTEKPVLNAFIASDYFIIPSFVKPKNKNQYNFFYPIIRGSLLKKKTKSKDYFLVYASTNGLDSILPVLKELEKYKFVIYGGKQKTGTQKNMSFKKFSGEEFDKDLLNCKAIICHGGSSLLSEATILKKPAYVFTTKDFFERYFNGALIKKMGFGELYEEPTKENLYYFLNHLEKYKKELEKKDITPGNKEITKKIRQLIDKNKDNVHLFHLKFDKVFNKFKKNLDSILET